MVLIDTWWNVNLVEKIGKVVTDIVLIDTWWNVNEELEWFVDTVISFNRYMVECEFFLQL